MKLYTYFRSSAAYRVRIALQLKGLSAEMIPIHLVKNGGMQLQAEYRAINPEGLVPALADQGHVLTQSLAIIEYLDEIQPAPALMPNNALDRAWVRSLALAIACDIHPLNNLRVLRYLTGEMNVSEKDKNNWYTHWCSEGLRNLETILANDARVGQFCHGDTPGLADCCLIPQLYNAQRFKVDLSGMPTLLRIQANCLTLPGFMQAAPEQQDDAE
jgi:maleylacetoacetate isomerase